MLNKGKIFKSTSCLSFLYNGFSVFTDCKYRKHTTREIPFSSKNDLTSSYGFNENPLISLTIRLSKTPLYRSKHTFKSSIFIETFDLLLRISHTLIWD